MMYTGSKYGWKCGNMCGGLHGSCTISERHSLLSSRLRITIFVVDACIVIVQLTMTRRLMLI